MNKERVAVKITKDAQKTTFVDSEVHDGVEDSGENTLFLRTRVFGFYKQHKTKFSISGAIFLIAAIATIYQVFFQHPTTSYAPQTMENSSGGLQVQGDGNIIVATPNREPITQYKILSTTEKLEDGFHTKIEILISFDKKGRLHISPKIYCEEYKDRERRVFQFEGGAYSGLVFNLNCRSSELIQEGNDEYFKYINDK